MDPRVSFSVHAAAPAEAPVVSAILQEAAAWCEARGMPLWKANELDPDRLKEEVEQGLFYRVQEGSETLAVFKFQGSDPLFWPDVPADEAAYVHRIAVKRQHAGRGLPAFLLDWCAEQARARGCAFLRLDTEASRPKLRAIYEGLGFRLHSERNVGPYRVARYERPL